MAFVLDTFVPSNASAVIRNLILVTNITEGRIRT